MKSSLKQQILGTLIIVGLVPLLALFAYTRVEIGKTIRATERERIADYNEQLASHLRAIMRGTANNLANLQTNPIIANRSLSEETRKKELERIMTHYEEFLDVSLYHKDGFLDLTTAKHYPPHDEDTEWFHSATSGKTAISHPGRSFGRESLVLNVYLPILASDGSVTDVLVARQDFKEVAGLIQRSSPREGGKILLLEKGGWEDDSNASGTILSSSEEETNKLLDPSTTFNFWINNPQGNYLSRNDIEYFYSADHISSEDIRANTEWILLAMEPKKNVEAVLSSARTALRYTTLAALVIAVIFGLFISHKIAGHVVNLRDTAREVAAGNLDVHLEPAGFKEVRDLGESFNLMVGELKTHQNRLSDLVRQRTEKYRQSQENLKITTTRLRAAFNASRDGILVTDANGEIIIGNPVFEQLLELPDLSNTSMTATDLRDHLVRQIKNKRDARQFLETMLKADSSYEKEINLLGKGEVNDYRVVSLFTCPIPGDNQSGGRLWVLRDLTETRLLEENLRQSQKMEAIGTLAGGVAHDFNNLLTGITGHLALLDMEHLGENHGDNKELLGRAIHASNRASDLVKKLLGFSRQSHIELRPCDAHAVVDEVHGILVNAVNPDVNIDLSGLQDEPWSVLSDPSLINSIIMNMAVNAIDAMPEGGTLSFRSENRIVSPEEVKSNPAATPGDYLCLIVEDDGEGIPEAIQQKIFEPFFTTKEQGKGTGLGLATCFGIADQLGGWITFESKSGVGTTFHIYLPRSADAQKKEKKAATDTIIGNGNGETLLLVDDEHVVRSVAEKLLSKLGYNILTASDGEEAVRIFEEGKHNIDLVLLDMTMPKKSGSETFTEIRDNFDYVPVLICSGYLVDLSTFETKCGAIPDGFVQKPYQVENMAASVRDVLDKAQEKAA